MNNLKYVLNLNKLLYICCARPNGRTVRHINACPQKGWVAITIKAAYPSFLAPICKKGTFWFVLACRTVDQVLSSHIFWPFCLKVDELGTVGIMSYWWVNCHSWNTSPRRKYLFFDYNKWTVSTCLIFMLHFCCSFFDVICPENCVNRLTS